MIFPGTSTDIPEDLLKYQAEGKLVFFCGAGISRDAGMPLFKGLLDKTSSGINHILNDNEKRLRKTGQFDQLYSCLERANGDRICVRKESVRWLSCPVPVRDSALSKHISLLKLSRGRDNMSRLVTTNYDSLFDIAQEKLGVYVQSYAAPLLPVPKEYKWDGIVYIHGKLDREPTEANLESLVLSSGDFGQAYLTERWASRFLSELFRDYAVCFVGYSVNDVILKYMVDAITAERCHQYRTPEKKPLPIYAFSGVKDCKREIDSGEWGLRGIVSIPYSVVDGSHNELSVVLDAWARYHENGRMEKGVIVKEALKSPPDSVSEVGCKTIDRVIWALEDELGCKGLPYGEEINEISAQWIEYIPNKLIRGKTASKIISWIGGHHKFPESLQWCIRNQHVLDAENIKSLFNIIFNDESKKDRLLFELWRFFLLRFQNKHFWTFFSWMQKRKEIGTLTPGLRREFKKIIQPNIEISVRDKSFYPLTGNRTFHQYFEWSIVIDDAVHFIEPSDASCYLSELMLEMMTALVEACEILKEFDERDFSSFYISSLFNIKETLIQNNEWYQLLILMRYGLLGVEKKSKEQARRIVEEWMQFDYPAFYRLSMWGFSRLSDCSSDIIVAWLETHQDALWIDSCLPELLGLMEKRFNDINAESSEKLQKLILYPSVQIQPTDRERATRLQHLKLSGVKLMPEADTFIDLMLRNDQCWANRNMNLDGLRIVEFDDIENGHTTAETLMDFHVPLKPDEAMQFFIDRLRFQEKGFSELFRNWLIKDVKSNFQMVIDIGVKCNYWSDVIWKIALDVTRTNNRIESAVSVFTVDAVEAMPIKLLSSIGIELGFWLQSTAKQHIQGDAIFPLCKKFLSEVPARESVRGTMNAEAPYELIMETLLRNLFDKQSIGKIDEAYKELFSLIVKGSTLGTRYARKILFQQISSLYVIDSEWTIECLVPLLSWERDYDDVKMLWENAILSNRYEPILIEMLWADFEITVNNYLKFDPMSRHALVNLLVCHAINAKSQKIRRNCRKALEMLPSQGRGKAALCIYEKLSMTGINHDAVWRNDILPFLKNVWPGDKRYREAIVFTHLADGILFLDEDFESAVEFLRNFARTDGCGLTFWGVLYNGTRDGKKSHCVLHPKATLTLLSYIRDFSKVTGQTLKNCLDLIREGSNNDKKLIKSSTFMSLQEKAVEKGL